MVKVILLSPIYIRLLHLIKRFPNSADIYRTERPVIKSIVCLPVSPQIILPWSGRIYPSKPLSWYALIIPNMSSEPHSVLCLLLQSTYCLLFNIFLYVQSEFCPKSFLPYRLYHCSGQRQASRCTASGRYMGCHTALRNARYFLVCYNSRKSKDVPGRVVGMYSHLNMNLFSDFYDPVKKVFKGCSINPLQRYSDTFSRSAFIPSLYNSRPIRKR